MPKKEPSQSVEQKTESAGAQKHTFDQARSAFDKAKELADELRGAVRYFNRGPEDYVTDDGEEELAREYGKYTEMEEGELEKELARAEAAEKKAHSELVASAREGARNLLEKSEGITQESLNNTKEELSATSRELRAAKAEMTDMEKSESEFLKEFALKGSKTKDQAGIKSELEHELRLDRQMLTARQQEFEKAKELKALSSNIFKRLMNSSKIMALTEELGLGPFDENPDKILEAFKKKLEDSGKEIPLREKVLQQLEERSQSGAFVGRTPEYEAKKNALVEQIEDLTLRETQAEKQLREMQSLRTELTSLMDLLKLPYSRNIDEQKQVLAKFLEEQK